MEGGWGSVGLGLVGKGAGVQFKPSSQKLGGGGGGAGV